jgi:hypothetical protein
VSSDRIVVENCFGRLYSLWEICSRRYRWAENLYHSIFSLGVALTNFHIERHPLRSEDVDFFTRRKGKMTALAEERIKKRQMTQNRYRANRRLRTNASQHSFGSPDDYIFSP